MKNTQKRIALAALIVLVLHSAAHADLLGSAGSYAVLGGSTVTNTGLTVLKGDLGVWPGTAITGFGPGIVVNGTLHKGDSAAHQAHDDLSAAYDALAAEPFNVNLTGQGLGGLTLHPGVYRFAAAASLSGILTLDAQGDPHARFDFQIGSSLTTLANSSVVLIGGGQGGSVYWQVGTSATLGTDTAFAGHLLASTSITVATGASIRDGNALARDGAVTLDTNAIAVSPVPEPTSLAALGLGTFALLRRRRS